MLPRVKHQWGIAWGMLALAPQCVTAQSSASHIYSAVSIASDYRYNGVSLADGEPVAQGYLHWQGAHGNYAGMFATRVDFNDPSNTSYELDVYTGRKFGTARREVGLELLYSTFPEKQRFGPTYDFLQLKTQVHAKLAPVEMGALATWTPEGSFGSGTVWRVGTDAHRMLTPWLSISAALGRRWIEQGSDRTYWDLGFTLTRGRMAVDVRYVDTNLTPTRCGFNADACGAAVVATLTWTLPAITLR